jgi:kynureninase
MPALPFWGGVLALEVPDADELSRRLAEHGMMTDSRGRYLRLGPAPYLSDDQLAAAVQALRSVAP